MKSLKDYQGPVLTWQGVLSITWLGSPKHNDVRGNFHLSTVVPSLLSHVYSIFNMHND
jgi:hypothetical protein